MTTIKSSVAALLAVLVGAGAATGTVNGPAAGVVVTEGAAGTNIGHVSGVGNAVPLTVTNPSLTVTKPGTGSGTVTSDVGVINCGATCSGSYATGTLITLTAAPDAGNQFTGWLGPCTGTATCQFTINGDTTASATFAPTLLGAPALDIDGDASYSALTDGLLAIRYLFGLSDAALIDGAVGPGATRTTAAQIGGYLTDIRPALDIDGNGQADALTDGLLIVRYLFGRRGDSLITGAVGPGATRTVAADIETQMQSLSLPASLAYTLSVSMTGTGSGTVTSSPAGIDCGAVCAGNYISGTPVGLTATSSSGSTFSGWGGECAGTGACNVTMDAAKSASATFTLDTMVPPPVDPTVATSIFAGTAFLYTGPNPIQTGVAPGTIDARRAAVLRGKVLTKDGAALSGVTITILNHPEFGQTLSRIDGMFDMAVNGGGLLTVNYGKAGLIRTQRQVNAPWRDYVRAPDVALIPLDSQVTAVDLTDTATAHMAQGNPMIDVDGTRRATILFPAGTLATMTLANGSTTSLTSFHVRATEFTVGPNGPKTMPATLPPSSGYTYEVEYSVDEATAAGATRVSFSQTLVSYTENFLGFAVGTLVPSGEYDRQKGMWIATGNGRVVKILSISQGAAVLDLDGSGQAASPAALAALGINAEELQKLAALYPSGQSLWRVPIDHFLAID